MALRLSLSDGGTTLEMLDFTIRIGSTPTFLYYDLYLYSAYAAHYVYFIEYIDFQKASSIIFVLYKEFFSE